MRVQSMNGVDLNLFRFEYDLTWMAFFMDGADNFYVRYGGREDPDAESHLTQKSLARTMRQALDLHARKAVLKTRYKPNQLLCKGDEVNTWLIVRNPYRCVVCLNFDF